MPDDNAPSPLSAEQFHENTLRNHGATRRASDGMEVRGGVDVGYGVGGKRNAKGVGINEKDWTFPTAEFTVQHVKDHMAAIRHVFGDDPDVHQGSWEEKGNIVLDASDVFARKGQAKVVGMGRRERAMFDFKNLRDIPLGQKVAGKGKHPLPPGASRVRP